MGSASEQQLKNLWSALERYALMQEEHFAALRSDRLRDIGRWQGERERAFVGLSRAMESLGDLNRLGDQELAGRLRERIGSLLATENRLRKELRDRREGVRGQLVALRKGRSAVKRLGVQPESAPQPRFVSSLA